MIVSSFPRLTVMAFRRDATGISPLVNLSANSKRFFKTRSMRGGAIVNAFGPSQSIPLGHSKVISLDTKRGYQEMDNERCREDFRPVVTTQ